MTNQGKLYIVPTPVGNMTFRAIRILKEADLILAEDTRTSGILLKHFEIKNALQSHHKFNEHQTVESVINKIKAGANVALISDAGTPGISDPGFLVTRECVRNGIEVQCLPGATAFVPAVVASGLPNDRFCFEGFLPQKKGRMTRLQALAEERRTMIFYESPYRLVKTLTQLAECFGRLSGVRSMNWRNTSPSTNRKAKSSSWWPGKKTDRHLLTKHKKTSVMKKLVLSLMAFAAVLASCDGTGGNKSRLQAENDSLQAVLNERNAELDEMMGTFNEISEGFRQINAAENRVDLQRGALSEGSLSAKEQIASDIEFIRKQMEENKQQIAKLQQQLKNSRTNSAQLKKAVETLTQELVEKTKRIEELQAELASKNIRIQELDAAVTTLTTEKETLVAENEAKAQTVAAQDKALNAAWFVFGTKKELKDQRILTNTGVFRKGDVMQDEAMNKDYFTQIDIRTTKEIKLYSKSADLLTTHPAGTYVLEEDGKGQLTLRITDPERFWSVSKYLVIQVK